MFQIKICGIKSVKDAQLAVLAGADAVGLNFYSESARFVEPGLAEQIVKVLPATVTKVGVFVNASPDEIQQTAQQLKLDYVQLHGDEPPEVIAELAEWKVVRAFRCGADDLSNVASFLEQCRGSRLPDVILLDAYHPEEYGGTGQKLDWAQITEFRDGWGNLPLVLAGGLTPFNVGEAISLVKPSAVDTASGVESAPGNKDPMLVRAFINAAKKAFAAM